VDIDDKRGIIMPKFINSWFKLLIACVLILLVWYVLDNIGADTKPQQLAEPVSTSRAVSTVSGPVTATSPSQTALKEIEGMADPVFSGSAKRISLDTAAELGMGYSPLSGQLRGRALGPFKTTAREKT